MTEMSPSASFPLKAGAFLVGALSLTVLLGSFSGTRPLMAVGHEYIPMAPVSAWLALLMACAMAMFAAGPKPRARRAATQMTLVAGALSVWSLHCLLKGTTMPLERLLHQGGVPWSRVSALTPLALMGAATALLLGKAGSAPRRGQRQVAALASLLPLAIGALILLAYAVGAPLLYDGQATPMSLPSALVALVFGLSLLPSFGTDTWPHALFHAAQDPKGPLNAAPATAKPLIAFLLLVVGVWAGGSLFLRSQLDAARKAKRSELAGVASLKAEAIATWYMEREEDAQRFAASALAQRDLARFLDGAPDAPRAEDLRALWQIMSHGAYANIVLFDATGRERLAMSREHPVQLDATGRAELAAALGQHSVRITDWRGDATGRNPHLHLWSPVHASGSPGPAQGAMLIWLDAAQSLLPLVKPWPGATPSLEVFLVLPRNQGWLSILESQRQGPGSSGQLQLASPLQESHGHEAQAPTLTIRDAHGTAGIASLRPIAGTPWAILAKVDEVEAYASLRQGAWITGGALLGLVLVGALGVGIMVSRDRAAKMHALLALERERQSLAFRFEQLIKQANDSIFLFALDGTVLEANEMAVATYGYSLKEFQGMNLSAFSPAQEPASSNHLQDVQKHGSIQLEALHQAKDGTELPVEIRSKLVTFDGQRMVLSFIRDIARRVKAERDLQASESQHRNLMELLPDAAVVLVDGYFRSINPAGLVLFGATFPGELLGTRYLDRVDPAFRNISASILEAVVGGISIGSIERDYLRVDGTHFCGEITGTACEFEGDQAAQLVIRDITVRKRDNAELLAREERLRILFNRMPIAIVIMGIDNRIISWNPAAEEVFGFTAEEAMGREPRDFIVPEAVATTLKGVWQELLEGNLGAHSVNDNLTKDGRTILCEWTNTPFKDPEGEVVGVICMVRDITDLRRAEHERRRLTEELAQSQKLESLGSLAGGVAHDINNVLAAILSLSSAHRATLAPTEALAKALDTIVKACVRGRDVVKSLLYFARKDLVSNGPVDLNAICQELITLFSSSTLKQVTITTDLQASLGLIEGDVAALSHALMNLFVNAVDAMPEGGILVLQTRRHPEGGIEVLVTDTGQGMTAEVLARAMEPFYTTKPVGKGTGLGLSMVFGTMKAHKGTVEIRSEPGRGTEVTLAFPPFLPSLGDPQEAPAPPEACPDPAPDGGTGTILLVDDDDLIRMSTVPMLQMLGYQVQAVASGREALSGVEAGEAFDLVILDMNMPGLNGAQTLDGLLKLRPEQKVLMASGFSEQSVTDLIQGHPGVFSICKPFSFEEIKAALAGIGKLGDRS
jgi:PAS domain S-box-containing protein